MGAMIMKCLKNALQLRGEDHEYRPNPLSKFSLEGTERNSFIQPNASPTNQLFNQATNTHEAEHHWQEFGLQTLKATSPVIAGRLTGATIVTTTGCISMATQPHGQTTEIIACDILAITRTSTLLAVRGKLWWGHECPINAIKEVEPVTIVIDK